MSVCVRECVPCNSRPVPSVRIERCVVGRLGAALRGEVREAIEPPEAEQKAWWRQGCATFSRSVSTMTHVLRELLLVYILVVLLLRLLLLDVVAHHLVCSLVDRERDVEKGLVV